MKRGDRTVTRPADTPSSYSWYNRFRSRFGCSERAVYHTYSTGTPDVTSTDGTRGAASIVVSWATSREFRRFSDSTVE